jgi:hypothetical protein
MFIGVNEKFRTDAESLQAAMSVMRLKSIYKYKEKNRFSKQIFRKLTLNIVLLTLLNTYTLSYKYQ